MQERMAFCLFAHGGFTIADIAALFDVTCSRAAEYIEAAKRNGELDDRALDLDRLASRLLTRRRLQLKRRKLTKLRRRTPWLA